ncbi:MAG TPA: hypothetical protein PLV64_19900 [Anaerolineales bacterium]|jgi:hypothetical protein|nr:hypothetical protein [Anaerolineales bacterium]
MMKKYMFLFLVPVVTLSIALASSVGMANAQTPTPCAPPFCVYVDATLTTGNEDGSQNNPYSQVKEGKYYAQSQPNGALLYVKEGNEWAGPTKVAPVISGGAGSVLPNITIYILLGILALILILLGWQIQRQSQKIQD